MSSEGFAGFAIVVRPEWTTAGHLTVANYTLLFDLASDALREELGLGRDYAEANARSVVVVEAHLTFLREAREADSLRFRTRVLGVAEKRLHLFHAMHRDHDDSLLATAEMMLLHIDRTAGRSVAIPAPALASLKSLARCHARSPQPPQAGRAIALTPARVPVAGG